MDRFDQVDREKECPLDTTDSLPSHPRWVKAASLCALTSYAGQLACQFLAISGFWAIQVNLSRAMENPDPSLFYTDADVNAVLP